MGEDLKTAFIRHAPVSVKRPDGDAVLLQIYPTGNGTGRRFALNKTEHFVGRLSDLDISLEGEGLSRKHARIFRDETGWYIEDLKSTNGTLVNDVKVGHQQLNDGDRLSFGVVICKFLAGDNVEATYHEELYRLSIIDGLTQTHNKRYLLEFLEKELAAAVRNGTPLSIIMLDIDHFKKINDTHGHLVGDTSLKELSQRLLPQMRATDLLARYGGEEFAVVLPATGRDEAVQVAEKLRGLIASKPFMHDEIEVPATISLGVAEIDLAQPGRPEDLIGRADAKLYEAKRAGRNRTVG